MKKTVCALITARGGSKGIHRKNLALAGGRPLITWTITVALQSAGLQRVVVSTDDDEIAKVSRQWGAEVPFMRPAELAQDTSAHILTVLHAVEWLERYEKLYPEFILLLQPTSPLRSVEDIDNAINLILDKNAEAVVSVCESSAHPFLTKQINDSGWLTDFVPTPNGYLPRQCLPPAYMLNGAIFLTRTDVLKKQQTFFPEKTVAYTMPYERSIDIDTAWDLYLTNLILKDRSIDSDFSLQNKE